MILATKHLEAHRGRVAMVDGGFDPLHGGHIAYFEEAAKLGLPVLCNIASDAYVAQKHPPLLAEGERARIIDAIQSIDFVHVSRTSTENVLRTLAPRYYVKGSDWRDRLPAGEVEACRELGTEIVFLDTVEDSSTAILERFAANGGGGGPPSLEGSIQSFENTVFSQLPAGSDSYDEQYFASDWRGEGNRYDLETRRRIEDRNPALIKEVFAPERVLDMGCGPGFLMALLHELGVQADGIDFSPESRELAPADVRDRIIVGEVTGRHVDPRSYDLVVCREVLEHLTVLQVRRTVERICEASSRFAYVTTRFHPDPPDLLAVTTQLEVDPTHITLLSKEFLRCLFVLEGFRQRVDLEAKMDWARKGRVLVYERQEDVDRG